MSVLASETVARPVVFGNDLNGFIEFIWNERNYTNDVQIKVGIDGGGGSFQICLTFNKSIFAGEPATKKSISDLKDSGVKKLFVIGIVPDISEKYFNVLILWDILKLKEIFLKFKSCVTISTDLKLANILDGIISHSSLHPCTWGDITKTNLNQVGELRTIHNVTQKHYDWSETIWKLYKFTNYFIQSY